jgi:hypothetical protein
MELERTDLVKAIKDKGKFLQAEMSFFDNEIEEVFAHWDSADNIIGMTELSLAHPSSSSSIEKAPLNASRILTSSLPKSSLLTHSRRPRQTPNDGSDPPDFIIAGPRRSACEPVVRQSSP